MTDHTASVSEIEGWLRRSGTSDLRGCAAGAIQAALDARVIVARDVEHDGRTHTYYDVAQRCPASWFAGPCPGEVVGSDGRCATHTRDGVAFERTDHAVIPVP